MRLLPVSGFTLLEPEEADPEVAQLYADIQRETELPFVSNASKSLGSSPGVLAIYRDMMKTVNQHITLPQSLVPMILYAIAYSRHCTYCAVMNESFCREIGVDQETLENLAHDLGNINPKRLQVIIEFALKCALNPQGLEAADYELVREQGVSDEELIQIIFLAALGNFNDTMADSLKSEPDPVLLESLGR